MIPGGHASGLRQSRSLWLLLSLLVLSIFINYIDRSNLSIAAPLLQAELSLTPSRLGALLSAFFWTYALLQLFGLSGWLADRFPAGWVLGAGFLLWSFATIATGLLSSFQAIYAARLVLGAGESLAYPCYSRIFASDVPQEMRGRANALLDAGSKAGPALGTFIGGILLLRLGWRWFFVLLGAASLLWLVPWIWHLRRERSTAAASQETHRVQNAGQMLRLRPAWGTFLGHFCGNYFWFFLLTWVPSYLVKERGLSIETMANLVSFCLAAVAAATVAAGWVSDRLIARGASPTKVRKTIVVCGLGFSSVILPAAFVPTTTGSIAFLVISCTAFGLYTSNHWAIAQTLAGPSMAGRWTSLQNGIGNISGILAPWLAGVVVETTGSSKPAFVVSAVIALAGSLFWGLVVGKVEPVRWRET